MQATVQITPAKWENSFDSSPNAHEITALNNGGWFDFLYMGNFFMVPLNMTSVYLVYNIFFNNSLIYITYTPNLSPFLN